MTARIPRSFVIAVTLVIVVALSFASMQFAGGSRWFPPALMLVIALITGAIQIRIQRHPQPAPVPVPVRVKR